MAVLYLNKGASVTCPNCFKSVLQLTRDVYEYETIKAEQVEVQEKYVGRFQRPRDGDPIACLHCKSTFNNIIRNNPMEGVFAHEIKGVQYAGKS